MTTAQRKVLARFPSARCRKHRGTSWFSVGLHGDRCRIIGSGETRGKAWANAADRLPAFAPSAKERES